MIRLTDEQWERIRDHFPEENIADGRPGRKPIPTRCVLEAVLWILNTGAQWHMLPQSYPNYKTVHRRFQSWCRDEVLRRVLTDVANELRDSGALNEEFPARRRMRLTARRRSGPCVRKPRSIRLIILIARLLTCAGSNGATTNTPTQGLAA
jgi:transposase